MPSVDIEEPQRRALSREQKQVQESSFLLILHRFLLLYLTLHNFLIPLILNSYNGVPILSDVHYWFIFQFHLHLLMVKYSDSPWVPNMMLAGIFGSLTRLFIETYVASKMNMSWGIFSIYLSEVATLIFYAFYFNKKDFHFEDTIKTAFILPFTLLTISSQFIFNQIEVRGELNVDKKYTWDISAKRDWTQYGCLGSIVDFDLKAGSTFPLATESHITQCGFTSLIHSVGPEGLTLVNDSGHTAYMSLYHMKKHSGQLKWMGNKLYILKDGQRETIPVEMFRDYSVYLLKSNQQQDLGVQVIINEEGNLKAIRGHYHITPINIDKQDL